MYGLVYGVCVCVCMCVGMWVPYMDIAVYHGCCGQELDMQRFVIGVDICELMFICGCVKSMADTGVICLLLQPNQIKRSLKQILKH